jgi:hypothetical protein
MITINGSGQRTEPTTLPPNRGTLPFLPGRTVTDDMNTGIVIDADTDTCRVRWQPEGITERCAVAELRAVNPDRPMLAHDELYASALGEELARRTGPVALAGFHNGWNNGRISYTETARDMLRRLDERALELKQARCLYTYVVDPQGVRRADRGDFRDGDRLITCSFYADGPGSFGYCGAHCPGVKDGSAPSSIFYALPEQHASGEAVEKSPFDPIAPVQGRVAA